ncbi:hypothetical protein LTSESEN_6397 [Salmonella enterica subsp. enterica serovar Senftenberg str. A4-543]|uniref:Uncharacterized protein n=1 Tax=Salmonella enterica subsp. enterica serovar Senftenberg str. A4-543 TaxID=913082 RepID=G5R975_SALSE|nr:hypothetical protein LTSESEN_6397 [Salmonella enterica subsp. enterica serovar Senftenberg str. A4-543]
MHILDALLAFCAYFFIGASAPIFLGLLARQWSLYFFLFTQR